MALAPYVIRTNNARGSEAVVHKAPVRDLTTGEISMLKLLFKDSIDYHRVKIHGEGYITDYQNVPMTPDGEIYYPPKDYQPDYSLSPLANKEVKSNELYQKITFIHEMAHVWQAQHGMKVLLRGIAARLCSCLKGCTDPYLYTLSIDKDLADYGVEQQAQIIADYYALNYFRNINGIGYYMAWNNEQINYLIGKKPALEQDRIVRSKDFLQRWQASYKDVLLKFLNNPGSYKWQIA